MTTTPWRIMAVDDDSDILELIRMSLTPAYEVFSFSQPMKAVRQLDVIQPDLLILDIMMPKMTGYQIIEMVKEHRIYTDIPVLFLSAKDANRDIKYGYKLGATVYLTKPFQPDRLRRNIDELFTHSAPPRRAKKHTARELEQLFAAHDQFGVDSFTSARLDDIEVDPAAAKESAVPGEEEEVEEEKTPRWVD